MYGYHRLKDPLVQQFNEKGLLITKQSEIAPPEPIDNKPILFGRHDLQKTNGVDNHVSY